MIHKLSKFRLSDSKAMLASALQNVRYFDRGLRYFLTLVALFAMTAGAWAQQVVPVAGQTNQWEFEMPAGAVELTVVYKTVSQLEVTFGGEAIDQTNGVTGFLGFEGEFANSLAASVTGLSSAMFTYKSSDATVIAFGEANEAEGALADIKFLKEGSATLTVKFPGNDDYGKAEMVIPVTVTEKTYTVSLKDGTEDAAKWTATVGTSTTAQPLPVGGLSEGDAVSLNYSGRLKVKGVTATIDAGAPAAPAGNTVDLSTLKADYVAKDGDVLTNATTIHKVKIADGATVTLDGVTISVNSFCIKCAGSATIILKDGTTNTLTSTSTYYPALWAGDTNTTLTIQGNTGVLDVTSGSNRAGIGGGYSNTDHTCGNIRIEGGFITARGGAEAAGIGTDYGPATCGDIIITGGTINATGGQDATGIGAGRGAPSNPSNCGAITITNGVTKVTATKGVCTDLIDCIGAGYNNSSCGTVTIGGTVYWENNAYANGGDTYLTTSPLIYQPSN
jgi:hypothetical protein